VVCVGHTFSVVWEQGDFHDAIYFIDNAVRCGDCEIDEIRISFLESLKRLLSEYRPDQRNGQKIKVATLFKQSRFFT
jgi:hypothetical protein